MTTSLRRTLVAGGAVLAVGFGPATAATAAPAAPHPTRAADTTVAPANYDARRDPALTGALQTKAALLAANPSAAVSSMRAASACRASSTWTR